MTLWRHQRDAINLLAPLKAGGCYFEMGAGKTRVALELLRLWSPGFTLVVAPKAVLPVWQREAVKHFNGDFSVTILNGSLPARTKQAQQACRHKGSIVVTNYEAVWREPLATLLMQTIPGAIILDEAHKIKAPGGKASRFLSRLGKLSRRRLALTGTPLPHSPLDCYSLYRFLDPSIFGYSFVRFRARYATMGGFQQHQVIGWTNLEELHAKMYSIACRVRSEDVLDLPDTLDETLTFELSSKARKLYRDLEKDLVAEIESGQVTAANAMVKLIRLQQLTGGWLSPDDPESRPEQVDTGKAEVLKELIEGMGQEQVVVFCRFHRDLDSIHAVCKSLGVESAELSGRKNELPVWEQWKAQVLAAQLQSGGLGIDLSQARYCCYFSHGFSLGDYMQSRARVHRPGQTRKVTYYHLCAAKTVDEKVMKALEKRSDLVKYVVDTLRQGQE
jgi:SNF2 family DNA or RNA helicase